MPDKDKNADDKANKRVKIAAGEPVTFRVKNSHLGNPVWTATGGCFEVPGASTPYPATLNNETEVTWYAPKNPGTHTVTATFPKSGAISAGPGSGTISTNGGSATITFEVVLPSGASVANLNEEGTGTGHTDDNDIKGSTWIGVSMELKYTAEPRDVNYSLMLLAEDNSPNAVKPLAVKDYFEKVQAADKTTSRYQSLIHKPRPENAWIQMSADGTWPDFATYPQAFSQYSDVTHAFALFWETGSFHWDIPVHFRGIVPGESRVIIKNPGQSALIAFPRSPGEPTYRFTLKQEYTLTSDPNPGWVGTNPVKVTLKCTKSAPIGEPAKVSTTIEN